MAMGFRRFQTFQYKNLHDQEILLEGKKIFLRGENGQGKTNFLEMVYVLSLGSSFFSGDDTTLIKNSYSSFSLFGDYKGKSGFTRIHLKKDEHKKKIFLNDVPIKDRKTLLDLFPCIFFSHDDINMVLKTPQKRRNFVDQTLALINPEYVELLRSYHFFLSSRNASFKKNFDLSAFYDEKLIESGIELMNARLDLAQALSKELKNFIFPFERSFSGFSSSFLNAEKTHFEMNEKQNSYFSGEDPSAEIVNDDVNDFLKKDASAFTEDQTKKHSPSFPEAPEALLQKESELKSISVENAAQKKSDESENSSQKKKYSVSDLNLSSTQKNSQESSKILFQYVPSWKSSEKEKIKGILEKNKEVDLRWNTTTSGPHRDDFFFSFQKKNYLKQASTGQMRFLALLLKVYQARMLIEKTGKLPILLFDDVFLELDPHARALFFDALPEFEQAFFTFLPQEDFSFLWDEQSELFEVVNGKIQPFLTG